MAEEIIPMHDYRKKEQPVCSVMLDGTVQVSDDFLAVLCDDEGHIGLFFHTDAATLGIAIKMISAEYIKIMQELSEDEQSAVTDLLGPAFSIEALDLEGEVTQG